MSEIKTPIIDNGDDTYLINESHTLADVVRWLIEQAGGADEILRLLEYEDPSILANAG